MATERLPTAKIVESTCISIEAFMYLSKRVSDTPETFCAYKSLLNSYPINSAPLSLMTHLNSSTRNEISKCKLHKFRTDVYLYHQTLSFVQCTVYGTRPSRMNIELHLIFIDIPYRQERIHCISTKFWILKKSQKYAKGLKNGELLIKSVCTIQLQKRM